MMLKQAFKFVYIPLWKQKTLHSSMACYVQVLTTQGSKTDVYMLTLRSLSN
jgi:hypothetical protein